MPSRIPETWCVYCGDFNECQDHITPVCWNGLVRKLVKTETVNCCNMCNGLASDFLAYTIAEKATHLIERYTFKYGGYKSKSKWTMQEINELKGWLRNKIQKNHFLHALFNAKFHNLELSSCGIPVPGPIRIYDTGAVQELTKVYMQEYEKLDQKPIVWTTPKPKPTRAEILANL